MGCKFYFGRKKKEKEKERNEKKKEKNFQRIETHRGGKNGEEGEEKGISSGENTERLHDGVFFGKKRQAKRADDRERNRVAKLGRMCRRFP